MISRLYTLFFLAFFGGFILLSCNGRDKAMVSPQESLRQKKLLDSFSENIKYIPEDYAEVETDTTLSNGFRVYIKTFTDMESTVLNEFVSDTIVHKHYYRDSKVILQISKDEELVFEQNYSKNFFIENFPDNKDFLSESKLQGFWLNDNYNSDDAVSLTIYFCVPESDICNYYSLLINKNGSHSLTETDEEEIL